VVPRLIIIRRRRTACPAVAEDRAYVQCRHPFRLQFRFFNLLS
jgi:hypothetical protein